MVKILISGIGGKMGRFVEEFLKNDSEAVVVCGVDKFADPKNFTVPVYNSFNEVVEAVDVIIDFSVRAAVFDLIDYAKINAIGCVLATTGYSKEEQNIIENAKSTIAIFQSGNYSLGMYLMIKLAKVAAEMIGDKADIEIIEQHHNEKVDAPSGTALMIANGIKSVMQESEFNFGREGHTGKRTKNEIGIHAVRGGTIVGKHEAMFIMNNEIVTIKHEAESKKLFAVGAIKAAKFLSQQKTGIYSMEDMLG